MAGSHSSINYRLLDRYIRYDIKFPAVPENYFGMYVCALISALITEDTIVILKCHALTEEAGVITT
jgi:hypothetical protein